MAVLNESQDTTPSQTGGGDTGGGTDDTLDKFNDLVQNVTKLLDNPVVQQRIQQNGQDQGRQVMGNQGQTQADPRQIPADQGRPQGSNQVNQGETPTPGQGNPPENQGYEMDLRDYFADKIKTEEGRQELADQIDALTDYLDPDASLEQIQEEVTSDEFVEKVEQLKEAGMI